jgi:hypothetical protein
MIGNQGLPAPYKVETGGTNVYATVDTSGAAEKQIQMLKMLTGGKKTNGSKNVKKGGSSLAPQTLHNGEIIVQQFPNGGVAANQINVKLQQIAGQAQANSAYDAQVGGRRRKYKKKTKRTYKKRRGQKKTKTRRRYN